MTQDEWGNSRVKNLSRGFLEVRLLTFPLAGAGSCCFLPVSMYKVTSSWTQRAGVKLDKYLKERKFNFLIQQAAIATTWRF